MVMASAFQLWILVAALVVGLEGVIAQDCNKNYTARSFTDCSKLGSLDDADSVAGWGSWGINHMGGLMPGTQALVASWDTAWANVVVVYQYDLTVVVAYHPETPPYPI